MTDLLVVGPSQAGRHGHCSGRCPETLPMNASAVTRMENVMPAHGYIRSREAEAARRAAKRAVQRRPTYTAIKQEPTSAKT